MLLIKIVNQSSSKLTARYAIPAGKRFNSEADILSYFNWIKVHPGDVRCWDTMRDNKIDAIKVYRQITGQSLKESKDVIDFCVANKVSIKYVDYLD